MTKYPSILTYHKLGEKGKLLDEVQVPFDQPAILAEKIDGVNSRIIIFPDGLYIIGSREELLYAKGDLIGNPQYKKPIILWTSEWGGMMQFDDENNIPNSG